MSSMAIPVLQTDPRRLLFEDGVWRDAISQPLYSTVGLNNAAIPNETRFFNYARGQAVPGAGNFAGVAATSWHTNMDIGGQLAKPQKFRCTGVRFNLVAFAATTAANTPELSDPSFGTNAGAGTAAANSDLLDDLLLLTYSCGLRIRIGTKLYLDHPLMFVPSEVGFGGVAAVGVDNQTAAAGPGWLDVGLFTTKGIQLDFTAYPFLIEEQQAIEAALIAPWTTPALADDRAAVLSFLGLHYREVA